MINNVPYFSQGIWQTVYFGNTLATYLYTLFLFLSLVLVFQILQIYLISRLKKAAKRTANDVDDTAIDIVQSVKPPIYITLAFFFAVKYLSLTDFLSRVVDIAIIGLLVAQAINATQILITYLLRRFLVGEHDESTRSAVKTLTNLSRGVLWGIGALVILQNVGVNVTSLVAGLGIGGIAIAFAFKEILADLFSSFTIIFDKPFQEGDFIIVGKDMGVVKKIGIKTTRIQALQGEEIVMSNQQLTTSTIQNFKKMEERRVVFKLGVAYQTPHNKLKKIPDMIKKIIEEDELLRYDRANLFEFGDSALIYEIVYYTQTNDYNEYMDSHERINLDILKAFEKEKIEIAYPTQTIFLKK